MQFIENKNKYIKCNILMKLQQLSLFLVLSMTCLILGIVLAVVQSIYAVIVVFVLFGILSAYILFYCIRVRKASQKAWTDILGQVNSCKSNIELINNETINIKRDCSDITISKRIADITCVKKYGDTVVLLFSDNTSFTLSRIDGLEDLSQLLATEQISKRKSTCQKASINKLTLQLSVSAFVFAFLISYIVSDAMNLSLSAWIQYSYIMYFFAVIPIGLLIINIIFKNIKGTSFALATVVVIALFGSFNLYFKSQINYDVSLINNLEQRVNYSFPEPSRLITQDNFYYTTSIGKFEESKALDDFEQSIQSNDNWISKLNLEPTNNVNSLIIKKAQDYQSFLIYNERNQQYYHEQDNIDIVNCVLVAYNSNTNVFLIIYDFKI